MAGLFDGVRRWMGCWLLRGLDATAIRVTVAHTDEGVQLLLTSDSLLTAFAVEHTERLTDLLVEERAKRQLEEKESLLGVQ